MASSIQSTQTSFYVTVLSISLASFFFFQVNSTQTETTSFSIPNFVSNQPNLIFQGDAYATNEKLTLTKAAKSQVGRALYSAPIHIWDSRTGNVADFITSFTFVITPGAGTADGLAFFIAPVDTKPRTGGGYLGVFDSHDYNHTSQTVAVEFDTFRNAWDPNNRHIGIDVNSVQSISTAPWVLLNGREANVVISFKAATNVLNVSLSYPLRGINIHSDVVVLKNIVPEWVRIGLSASTGLDYAAHEILSWSFHSELVRTSSSNQVAAA
ncbi:lectin beta-1 and beta-2 chains-like [Vicia villosa]|uniref:lectin beta-1 and beta-2 chains-like n=1 Tax=Vicia villosa TaxID=3911 RepID=UPI00273C8973|nr:lectin beta-1 and beta-2 chains-like [Vicia villosa]